MLIDLTCPAEVFQTALPTEEIPAVSLALYNLSDRIIVSVEVTLKLLSGSGIEKDRVVYRARALNGRPHSAFQMNVPCEPNPAARRADVTIDKVWFSDNAVWRREMSSSVEYISNELPVSKALTSLKFVAGEAAVGFPSQQDGLWVCVCGRPNPDSEEICARCRRQKDLIFTRYNREAVEKQVNQRERQLDLSTRSVREDTARMQRIREEEYNQEQGRKARRRRMALCLPLCALIVAAAFFIGLPALRLWAANRAMEQEDWTTAVQTLRAIDKDCVFEFPGVSRRLAECEWQEALILSETAETPAELLSASQALRAIGADSAHPESIRMADDADVARARLAMEAKDPDAAIEALSLVPPDDPRRVEIENEIRYSEAKSLMAAGKYEDAREVFLQLTDLYPEAKDLAAECVYIPASAMIDEGLYEAAISEMNRIPEHPQSRMAIQECHYKMAEEALAMEDLETAAAEFLKAGDWGDAPDRTAQVVFTMAEKAYEEGDIAGAQTLYASIPGYEPAVEKSNECLLKLAKTAINQKDYDTAISLLDALPEDYPGADGLIPRAAYLAGTAAIKAKEYEKAVAMLERAGEYRDAPAKLDQAIESLVNVKIGEGDAAAALALLERIPKSKNYRQLSREAEYLDAVKQAEALLESGEGDPEALRAKFDALGSFKDAKTWVKRMVYTQAERSAAAGETLAAAKLYLKAGDWSDAKEKAAAQYDAYYGGAAALAREAYESGDYTTAATLLETLDRSDLPAAYSDLNELYENACVKAGEQLYQAGRPYEAAVFFRLANNPRKTQRYLNYACYRILGTWCDRQGNVVAIFRDDSTCDIAGETFTFLVSDSYTIMTETDGTMAATFRITELTDYSLSMRDMRPGHEQNAWSDLRPQALFGGDSGT